MRILALITLLCAPAVLHAQIGEAHLGAVMSYGAPNTFGQGAGVVFGVAAGRLTYVGLRWTYHSGSTQQVGTAAAPVGITTRVQTFALDWGVMFPKGAFEIVPGLSVGAARFTQHSSAARTKSWDHNTSLMVAPGISVQTRMPGFLLIPEIQYVLGADPKLGSPVNHRGAVGSLRIVITKEIGRIRH